MLWDVAGPGLLGLIGGAGFWVVAPLIVWGEAVVLRLWQRGAYWKAPLTLPPF